MSVAIAGTIFTGFGSAAAGVMLSQGQHLSASRIEALQSTFISGFRAAFIACAAFAAIGVFTALVRGSEDRLANRRS